MRTHDLIDGYYNSQNAQAGADIDSQLVSKAAIKAVLPTIMKQELTERQRRCLKMKYNENMTQTEIAKALKLSQPTVSRHIESARETVNNRLSYCISALNRANSIWTDYIQ